MMEWTEHTFLSKFRAAIALITEGVEAQLHNNLRMTIFSVLPFCLRALKENVQLCPVLTDKLTDEVTLTSNSCWSE